jgi:hypothetical protein
LVQDGKTNESRTKDYRNKLAKTREMFASELTSD